MKDKELPLILGYFEQMTHRKPIEFLKQFLFLFWTREMHNCSYG